MSIALGASRREFCGMRCDFGGQRLACQAPPKQRALRRTYAFPEKLACVNGATGQTARAMTALNSAANGSESRWNPQDQLAGVGVAVSAIVGSVKLLDTDPQVRAQAVE